jgi:hypothetical protein
MVPNRGEAYCLELMRRSVLVSMCAVALGACTESSVAKRGRSDATADQGGGSTGVDSGGGVAAGGTAAGTGRRSPAAGAVSGSDDASVATGGARSDSGNATDRADASSTPDAASPLDTGESVLERNKHPSRDGTFLQPTLTIETAAKMAPDTEFNATFAGSMFASPLYLEHGPGGKGVFFAVTTSNDVVALDEKTGATVWTTNVGPAPTANGVACGNIHPLGIVGTPVIDAASGTIYVSGAIGTTSIGRHEVHALSVMNGSERQGFPVVIKATSGATTFVPEPQNQRSALSLVNGVLYVAFGGHNGDCGNYHGWVMGIDTKDPTKTGGWATLGRGEGIWAAGGMASDGNGVFAVTGNSTAAAVDHMVSDSEEVVRVTGLGVLDRSPKNLYFPASWQAMDTADADFGANSPVYLTVAGSTPSHVLGALSKDGQLYLLDPGNLGGMAGHLSVTPVALGARSIHTVPAAYTTPIGTYMVLSINGQGLCPPPRGKEPVVMSILISPGAPPKPVIAWCAPLAGAITGPVATTADGNALVWYVSNGKLIGVNGDSGKIVFDGGTGICDGVRAYTSPIAVKGRIVVGGDGHLCSWSPH